MCMKKLMKKFKKIPTWILFIHVSVKQIFMLGLGIVLATYFYSTAWGVAGWILIAFALLDAIPHSYLIFNHKENKRKK